MDWNALKIFLAIARTGSLAGAARQLQVNHSTVFRRLQTLEQELGGRVFQRINNRYLLTPLGDEMLEIASSIEQQFDTLDRRIVGKDIQPRGTVRITAPANIANNYLAGYFAGFSRNYPDICIELLVSNAELNLDNRQADIAVRATPSPPGHLVGRQVASIGWSAYCGSRYKSRKGQPSQQAELAGHAQVGATGAMRSLPAFIWQEKHCSEQIAFRADDLSTMSYLAEQGRGLALLPDDQQRSNITALFPLDSVPPSKLWVLTHPDLRNVARIKLVTRHLADAFAVDFPV